MVNGETVLEKLLPQDSASAGVFTSGVMVVVSHTFWSGDTSLVVGLPSYETAEPNLEIATLTVEVEGMGAKLECSIRFLQFY